MGLRRRWAGAVLLCACRAAAEEQGLRRAGKERVLGVGLGVFLLSFFFISRILSVPKKELQKSVQVFK